jgi:hypothetical protein
MYIIEKQEFICWHAEIGGWRVVCWLTSEYVLYVLLGAINSIGIETHSYFLAYFD